MSAILTHLKMPCMSLTNFTRRILTHSTLCEIRHSLNTADSFYSSEQDYYDKNMPVFDEFLDKFCSAMLHSEFEKEICDEWGRHTLKKCEYRNTRFSPEIVKLMQEENSLASEYSKELCQMQK